MRLTMVRQHNKMIGRMQNSYVLFHQGTTAAPEGRSGSCKCVNGFGLSYLIRD